MSTNTLENRLVVSAKIQIHISCDPAMLPVRGSNGNELMFARNGEAWNVHSSLFLTVLN